ncbi:MAG: hypothetical protein KAH12_07330, partial [Anaerolineales bacterium]|nr:hypothetical protein [Anaerolineales bacterium]
GLVISDFEITPPPNNEFRLVSPPIDMAPGRQITITLSGELEETVYTGQNLINDAVATWTSRTGDVNSGAETGERTGQDGSGGLNNYVNTGSIPIDIVDPEPQKLIVTTSEAHTGTIGDPRLVIGEIIRYRLEVRLAEGTTNDLILRDNLLPGMIFINDGTAKVIFVSTSGIDIDSQDSAVPDVVPGIDDPTAFRDDSIPLINIVPVYVLPDGNISSSLDGNNDTYNSGSYVYFKLGDVFNSELDDNGEYAVIEFNALVANDGDTYSGRTRSNTFSVYADEDGDGNAEASEILDTSNSASIVIAEPDQSLTKTITTIPADAGDPVRYTLVLSNNETGNNDATAFDLTLTDTFDAELVEASLNIDSVAFTQVDGTCTGNGAGTTPFSHDGGSFSGYDFTLTATCLDPGRTITVIISAVLKDDVPAAYDLRNDADLAWTSLPGDKGTAANPTGSNVDDTSTTEDESGGSRGERNGSETPAINDYKTTDDADVDLTAPSIVKTVEAPAQWTIGETFTYDLVITLPEGVTPDMVVYDDIPDGLEFISYNLITTTVEAGRLLAANYDGTFTNDPPLATILPSGDLELNFGDTTTNEEYPDSVPTNNRFQVQVEVRMLNIAGNQNGDVLTNQGELRYSSGTTATGTVDVAVIEPVLILDKTVDDDTPGLDQTITYSLEIAHDLDGAGEDSQSDAFNVHITDTLPTGLSNIANITTSSTGNCASGFNTSGSTTSVLDVTINEIPHSLPSPGCVVTITFDATVDSTPDPNTPTLGDVIDNTAEITWTSILVSNGQERSGDGVARNVDDYETEDTQQITITNPDLRIDKDDGVTEYIPGTSLTYTIVVENVGNQEALNAEVTDTRPSQISTWTWSCIGATNSAT